MNIVIVESPAKAKTINKYLGSGYQVLASYGHVRDLPSKDGSVDPDDDFAMHWEVDGKSGKRLSEIAAAVKDADRLILATDPDREGEAISWHVLEVLRARKAREGHAGRARRLQRHHQGRRPRRDAPPRARSTGTSSTPTSPAAPSTIWSASRCRRCCGGSCPAPARPAGCSRSRSASSATASARSRSSCRRNTGASRSRSRPRAGGRFVARAVGFDGRKLGRLDIPDEATARAIEAALRSGAYRVASVEAKPVRRNPPPPFTTSTLQQEASRKLGFAAARTMQVAQRLYEDGYITYMRTDGVDIAPEALAAIRGVIAERHGDRYLPERPRHYQAKAKNAQEAHEAIRPTEVSRHPASLAGKLEGEQARLYEMIWKRTVACQMAAAEFERTTVDIDAGGEARKVGLRATGQVERFNGFLAVYQEGRDDVPASRRSEEDEDDGRLPPMAAGDPLSEHGIGVEQHFTEPPPRYTEATLIKKMEELGIGRPSTYTATLSVLRDRGYVRLEKKQLIPEDKGRLVTAFLESFFERYVEYDFTADLEEKLDKISNGEISWKEVLREFWRQFSADVAETSDLRVAQVLEALNELLGPHIFPPRAEGGDPRQCPSCGTGRLSLKLGKFGSFIGCSNYPECRYTRQLAASGENGNGGEIGGDGTRVLGTDPDSGLEVSIRSGRFGPYVQLGEAGEDGDKPKRSSLPRGWEAATLELAEALALLNLPREVGLDPETGTPITAGIGRYGPFVQHDGTYANLDSVEEVFSVGINRAVSLLAEKRAGGGRRGGRATPKALKTLGEHPTAGGPVTVRDGRYGAYVNHGKVNATLPKDLAPEAVTMEQAVELLEARAGKAPAKRPAAKKTTTKKTAKKKPPAKKSAAEKG